MSELNSGKIKITNNGNIIMQFSNYHHVIDSDTELCYKQQADKVIAELEMNLSEILSLKMQLEDEVVLLRRNNAELKKKIESMKVKFREFNNNVCKKIVDASRTTSTISQDAQMDFFEEFIKEASDEI